MANITFDESFSKKEYADSVIADFRRRAADYGLGENGEMHHQLISCLLTHYPPEYPVLDIACGTGMLGAHLGSGVGITGLDLTDGMLAEARRACPDGTFVQGRAEELPFADNTFGAAYICAALVYFTDVPKALREGGRVLKEGGFLAYQAVSLDSYIAGVVLERAVWKVCGEERGRYVFELPHGITNDEAANVRLMQDAGFVDVSVHKDVVKSGLSVNELERKWENMINKNGLTRRVGVRSKDELGRIHDVWVSELEKLRGADNMVEDTVTSWYVRGYKKKA